MSKLTGGKASHIAEKFHKNWKERRQNNEGFDEDQNELDDSLTNLQWLHNITVLDIAPVSCDIDVASSSNASPRSSEYDPAEDTLSEKSDWEVKKQDNKIDYHSDLSRKPPYSYATLICMAMRETKKNKITLSAIYKWIRENFVYYRHADPTWQVRNGLNFFLMYKLTYQYSSRSYLIIVCNIECSYRSCYNRNEFSIHKPFFC